MRIPAHASFAVDRPSLGHLPAPFVIDFHLAQGHHRCRGVKPEWIGIGRHAEGQRIGAQHHLPPKRGHHDGARIGHGERGEPLPGRHQRVVSRDPIVRGIADRHKAYACFFRLFHGCLHGLGRRQLPHGKMPVHQRGNGRFAQGLRMRMHVDAPGGDVLMIIHHALRAVALNAEQIRLHQHIRYALRLMGVKSLFFKCALHKRAKLSGLNPDIAHSSVLLTI